jgi:hypothetical protein
LKLAVPSSWARDDIKPIRTDYYYIHVVRTWPELLGNRNEKTLISPLFSM